VESVQTVGLFAGRHVIAEFDRVDPMLLDDELFLRRAVQQALHRAGATVLTVVSKRFHPQGVTVLALLSESHACLHTYPEFGSMFVDVFTCGTRADPERAVRLLAEALGNPPIRTETIQRGW
jgi:S-adenosylmethionine decarboxylase proenzyme